jgi:DHA1 family inner membrane transport protein
MATFLGMAVILALFALDAQRMIPTEITLFVWATVGFIGVPALQINVVNFAQAAPNLISTLNIAAFNAGNALGAWVGGEVISAGLGLPCVPLAASLLAVAALVLMVVSLRPRRRLQPATQIS